MRHASRHWTAVHNGTLETPHNLLSQNWCSQSRNENFTSERVATQLQDELLAIQHEDGYTLGGRYTLGEPGSQSSAASWGNVCNVPAQAYAYATYQYVASYMRKASRQPTHQHDTPTLSHTPAAAAAAAQGYSTTSPALATALKPHRELCNNKNMEKLLHGNMHCQPCLAAAYVSQLNAHSR
jgi:hypothetical protein